MDTLKVEEGAQPQAKEAVELIDCGRASERTKGGFFGVSFEVSFPPLNRFPA